MTGPPRWASVLLRWLAPPGQNEDVLGDLKEAHRDRTERHGHAAARVMTAVDTLDMAAALVRLRVAGPSTNNWSIVHDYKLGLRMLVKYSGPDARRWPGARARDRDRGGLV